MYMKTIDDIRKILAASASGNISNIIEKGSIADNNGKMHSYEIVEGWDIINAKLCDENWGRFNLEILDRIADEKMTDVEQKEMLDRSHLEDAHWSWFNKHKAYSSVDYNWCFFLIDGQPQGACLVYHPKLSVDNKNSIFYVEYVAAAPWNRPNIIDQPRFKGIGTKLLKAISKYSDAHHKLSDGFCLLSLPKAEGYYLKIGMNHFPVRDADSLKYFEMLSNEHQLFVGGA